MSYHVHKTVPLIQHTPERHLCGQCKKNKPNHNRCTGKVRLNHGITVLCACKHNSHIKSNNGEPNA